MENKTIKAKLTLLMSAILLSTGGLCIKSISITNALEISGLRSLVAALFFLAVFKKHKYASGNKWFPVVIISYSLMTTLYVASILFTTAASAIILQYTAPVFALFFSALIFKKMPDKIDISAVFVVFLGIAIVFSGNALSFGSKAMIGNILAICSGACFAMKATSLTIVGEGHARSAIFFGNFMNFLIALPFMITAWQIPTAKDLGLIFYMGIVQLGLSYMLYIKAVELCSPLELILIPAIEPVLNPFWVYIINGEKPGTNAVLGGIIVIGTVVLWNIVKEIRLRKEQSEKTGIKV